jgi:hypothetical protein
MDNKTPSPDSGDTPPKTKKRLDRTPIQVLAPQRFVPIDKLKARCYLPNSGSAGDFDQPQPESPVGT